MTIILSMEQNNISDHGIDSNTWLKLDGLNTIEQDTVDFITQHEGFTYNTMVDKFEEIKNRLTTWMENVHLTIFTMEQKAKEGTNLSSKNWLPLQTKMTEMEGLMGRFGDISEVMDEKFDDTSNDIEDAKAAMELQTKRMTFKMGITKLQSEWSGLHHFMVSVTKQVESANEKRELLVLMEDIMMDIDNLTSTIFEYQEKRHLGLITAASTGTGPTTATCSGVENGAPSIQSAKENGDVSLKDDALLADLDQRVKPVFLGVEKIYARMNSTTRSSNDDSGGILVRKHRLVQEKWECLRIEIDELKDELKEDRWLSVFRQVADQVDTMINGLNKTVQECYNSIQQITDWYELVQQRNHSDINSNGPSSPHSPSTFDKLSKSFLRSLPKSHQSAASVTSSTSTLSVIPPPPFDHKKLQSVEKHFEAKYKNYTPSIDRMLTMLGNGIASRATKDDATSKRQSAMLSRWQQLKITMDNLRMRDLSNAERYLVDNPHSPASSVQSDKSQHGMWKSIRRRTSNQESINSSDFNPKFRSASTINSLPRLNSPAPYHEDYRRVRSVTPSSGSQQRYQQSSKVYNRQQRTASPLNFTSHQSSTNYNRVIRPSTSDTSSIGSGSPSLRPTLGGRKSLTPSRPAWNTSIKPDKPEFSSLEPLWKGESRAIASGLDENSTLVRHSQGRKSLVPRPPSSQQHHLRDASFMKPTKSTMLRKRSQSVEPPDISRPKTPTRTKGQLLTMGSSGGRRTKTPISTTTGSNQLYHHLPPRPKSSLGRQESYHLLPYVDRERDHYNNNNNNMKSPIRRTGTPSLIPRPKTPTSGHKDFLQSTSPSLIPRPRSSMRMYQQGGPTIPPVPSLPNNIERPSIHMLKVGILNKEDIYENMEHDDDDEYNPSPRSPSTHHDSLLSVTSIFDSNDIPPLYHQQHKQQHEKIPQHSHHHHHHHHHQQQQQQQHSNHTPRLSTITRNSSNINALSPLDPSPSKQQRKRELLRKRSMPALAIQRSGSPFQTSPKTPTIRTTATSIFHQQQQQQQKQHPSPSERSSSPSVHPTSTLSRRRQQRQQQGYYSEDEEDSDEDGILSPHSGTNDHPIYTGDPRDPLDMEVATILNSSPIAMHCQKSPQGGGKYLFGNELNPTVGSGKKLYTCKLINYSGRRRGSALAKGSVITKNKVLVRVGGGWTELAQFLLDHALLL